ncbi:transglycosylase SLT domain-containing protein [soil metagenome]
MIAAAAAVVVVVVVGTMLLARVGEDAEVPDRMAGDIAEVVQQLEATEMPVQAAALLATDRPWRAARVMRSYLERVPDAPPEHRLLAARAEAGWGAWPEVRTLLEGTSGLDTREHGLGLYLLARARDEAGDGRGAIETYRSFLALSPPAGEREDERAAARLRLGLALIRAGEVGAGRRELQESARQAGFAGMWLDLLQADALAARGDTAAVRQAVAQHDSGIPGLRAWRARLEAARQAGDLAGARALANRARTWAGTEATRAEFLVTAGRFAVEMGDVAAGREAFRSAIQRGAASPHARAAAELLAQGSMTPDDHLAVARVNRAQGLHEESLDGYERFLAARTGTAAERADAHLEHANALFYAGRYADVGAALRPIAAQVSARMLHARAEAHRGDIDESVRIYLALASDYERSGTGTQALFLAASTRHDAGDERRARELYQRVISRYPGSSQMGLAMMRLAGMAFLGGDYPEAIRHWDQYRARYPRGANALQATYWAGRAREELGDTAAAAVLFRAVRQSQRDSYYALLASERLRVPFWPLPSGAVPPDNAEASRRVRAWMQGVDLLRTAGFHDDASAQVDRVVTAAGNDRPTLYALAEALAERGYAQRSLRLALRLAAVEPPNRRLYRILYPFPYRTLITEEARDRSLDPYTVAALIRQESVFEARITSPAGARGLMQIMPATGRMLADAVGIEPWNAELLYHPEINVHLGTRYVARHWENYDGSLPSVFSAYNAGSHRVEWWSEFPEYDSDELFTERIPFRETRDYVKILTRNQALYRGLYGE